MKLYESKISPNSRRVRVYLAEKGLTVEGVDVDIMAGENLEDTYLAINPVGLVPVLELGDGTNLTESSAICRYLEELHPDPPLMGSTALEKAKVDMWERKADFEGMLAVVENFRNRFPAYAERVIPGVKGVAQISELVGRGRQSVERFYGHLETQLNEDAYLTGSTMTLADISAMCVVDFALFCELEIPDNCPHVQTWYEGMKGRESARANPGLVALLGSYSKVLEG